MTTTSKTTRWNVVGTTAPAVPAAATPAVAVAIQPSSSSFHIASHDDQLDEEEIGLIDEYHNNDENNNVTDDDPSDDDKKKIRGVLSLRRRPRNIINKSKIFWIVIALLLTVLACQWLHLFHNEEEENKTNNNNNDNNNNDHGGVVVSYDEEENKITTTTNNNNNDHGGIVVSYDEEENTNNSNDNDNNNNNDNNNGVVSHSDGIVVPMTCPDPNSTAADRVQDEKWYVSASEKRAANIDKYLDGGNFRRRNYDDWGYTYEQVKEAEYDWKSRHFAADLKTGGSLYESACGIGLNLYMTLEIVHEVSGAENVVVYGNEYIPVSAQVAADIAAGGYLPAGGRLGTICTANSHNLSHVPANSFDVVYSGYITPNFDPLQEHETLSKTYKKLTNLCSATDAESIRWNDLAQEKQNDWYGNWIREMVRIAKPGAPVIIEQVELPYCQSQNDWGGVAKEWWNAATYRKYHWDVDPASLDMADGKLFQHRYHVFLRKNK